MTRNTLALAALIFLGFSATAQGQTVRLTWDANPENNIAGYTIVYGTTSRNYTSSLNVGNVTEAVVPGLTIGRTYFFAVRAVNVAGQQSAPSGEVAATIQPPAIALPSSSQLIWRNSTNGSIARWYMDGANQVRGESLGPGSVGDLNWNIVGSADFNRDGENDLLWQHANGQLAVWLMRGSTLLSGSPLTPGSIDPVWRVSALADVDNDGNVDILWRHQVQGYIAVWFMRGIAMRDGQMISPGQVSVLEWQIVGAGDLDGDGHVDLLWRHTVTGALSAWLMNGARQISGQLLTPASVPDTQWAVVAVADVNSDDRADIIWQHADGRLAVWVMNGTAMIAGVPLTPAQVPDPNWRIVAGR
jgi:hypothetical protein